MQMVAVKNLSDLFIYDIRAHKSPVHQMAMLENTQITREEDPLLFDGKPEKFGIGKVVTIESVKTKQTQAARQLAEVDVQDKGGR